jgi:malate dehydrogenase (oxaloacetate-decarboxylating)(NADP+)
MPGTDKSDRSISQVTDQEALDFHARGRPGKLEINPTKPMATQRDLSLAYSPGVAVPVKAIAEDPSRAFDYTAKGNMVAVISNGTAILGPRQSRRSGLQAGDGRQVGVVQALR